MMANTNHCFGPSATLMQPGVFDASAEDGHSWLYFLKSHDFVKIGRAKDLENRLGALQLGNPLPLRVEELIRVPDVEISSYENAVHRAFAELHHIGEWFLFTTPLSRYLILLKTLRHESLKGRRYIRDYELALKFAGQIGYGRLN